MAIAIRREGEIQKREKKRALFRSKDEPTLRVLRERTHLTVRTETAACIVGRNEDWRASLDTGIRSQGPISYDEYLCEFTAKDVMSSSGLRIEDVRFNGLGRPSLFGLPAKLFTLLRACETRGLEEASPRDSGSMFSFSGLSQKTLNDILIDFRRSPSVRMRMDRP